LSGCSCLMDTMYFRAVVSVTRNFLLFIRVWAVLH